MEERVQGLKLMDWGRVLCEALSEPGLSDREICNNLLLNSYAFKPQYPHTNSPDWFPCISFKNLFRKFDKRSKVFPFVDNFSKSCNFLSWLWYWYHWGKIDVGHIILCKVIVEILPAFLTQISSGKTKLLEFAFQTTSSWNWNKQGSICAIYVYKNKPTVLHCNLSFKVELNETFSMHPSINWLLKGAVLVYDNYKGRIIKKQLDCWAEVLLSWGLNTVKFRNKPLHV